MSPMRWHPTPASKTLAMAAAQRKATQATWRLVEMGGPWNPRKESIIYDMCICLYTQYHNPSML